MRWAVLRTTVSVPCWWCVVAAGVLVLGPVGEAEADDVTLVNGTRYSACKVVSEDATEVKLDANADGAADTTVPTEQIASIQYADRPLAYLQAELFLKSGKYDSAVTAFQRIAKEAEPGSWRQTYAAYYAALALQKWALSDRAKAAEAVAALNDFVTRQANSRFIYEARLSLAEAYLVQGKLDDVRRLAEAVGREKPNTRWGATGRLLVARVKLSQDDPAGAARDFEAVLAGVDDKTSAVWAQATIGRGLALLGEGKLDEAERILTDLIETVQDGTARAQAYNALGDAYFKRDKYAEARLKYLRVVLLYFNADAVEHAKALYHAAECFRRLGEEKRAEPLYGELVRRYPGTPWAAKSPVKPEPPVE